MGLLSIEVSWATESKIEAPLRYTFTCLWIMHGHLLDRTCGIYVSTFADTDIGLGIDR